MLEKPTSAKLFELLRTSTYYDKVYQGGSSQFEKAFRAFMTNIVARKEINAMPLEVYWSVAYAPLYNLIRFHHEGRTLGNKKFVLTDAMIWQTFELVIKAMKP